MITSRREARHVIKRSKNSGSSVTESLQHLNSRGRSYRKLQRRLLKAGFTRAESVTELTTASVTP